MTNVFNIFVVMQIFNMINSRKINDEINIFDGFFKNWVFVVIYIVIFGAQALIIQVGSRAFKVTPGGLSWVHWVIALGLGFTTWILALFLKMIPDRALDFCCPCFGKKNATDDTTADIIKQKSGSMKKEQSGSLRGSMRGAFRKSHSRSGTMNNERYVLDKQGSFQNKVASVNDA